MKKALSILTAACMAFSLAACGTSGTSSTSSEGADTASGSSASTAEEGSTASATGTVYHVGICQQQPHEALDQATQGFKDALVDAFGEDGVVFDEQNAQGDTNTCTTIINGFVSSDYDLIMANGTSALQAAAAGTAEIPILGTSVTEYGVALGLDDFSGTVGGNISGTSDLAPLDQQANMLAELFPVDQYPTVGMLYCSAEPNSEYQVEQVTGYLTDKGYTVEDYSFSDSNDLATIATNASTNCDVIYIPTDNTAASNTEIINNICLPAGVPIIAGEQGICSGCGVATLSISYYDLGYKTGEMAAQILTGEADISTMPIEYAPNFTKMYNPTNCEELGVTVPDDYVAIEG
ncbi:ABC transporter substrate-binding protein [uncultured Gemmiger sp.]|uniref:ABC transporter substrate-binding protein n=1 Tax=uncultured Gemmiger sp. TaxID=1623490 RepID=UPI0025FD8F3A|nr:ABC transporter substrate-binding protein [uncultured Gemmiger sp.]